MKRQKERTVDGETVYRCIERGHKLFGQLVGPPPPPPPAPKTDTEHVDESFPVIEPVTARGCNTCPNTKSQTPSFNFPSRKKR